jgi:hypothetical protein
LLLGSELGSQVASEFECAAKQTAVRALRLEAQVREVAAVAGNAGIPFALLKGAALHLLRFCQPGARGFCDLDILVPRGAAKRLFTALKQDGWSNHTMWRRDQHLPSLAKVDRFPVEIHDFLGIVSTSGSRWATYNDLEAHGELTSVPRFKGVVTSPSRAAIAAHLLTHCLVQPASRRASYLFRTAADLLDLGLKNAIPGVFTAEVAGLVGGGIPVDVVREITDFASTLERDPVASENPEIVAGRLMREAAGRLGLPQTPDASPLVMLRPLPGCPTPFFSVVRIVRRSIFVNRGDMEASYGHADYHLGFARLWLRRVRGLARRMRSA